MRPPLYSSVSTLFLSPSLQLLLFGFTVTGLLPIELLKADRYVTLQNQRGNNNNLPMELLSLLLAHTHNSTLMFALMFIFIISI